MNFESFTPEELHWHLTVVKGRYNGFDLSDEQAKQVYLHEEEKGQYFKHHIFSMWEEWDYDSWFFQKILSESQFRSFETFRDGCIKGYNDSTKNSDRKNESALATAQETIDFYASRFLPGLFAQNIGLLFSWMGEENSKILLLRTEYRRFLQCRKRELLVEHFRHQKTFSPNQLELLLLRNKAMWLWPDYAHFKSKSDEAVKAVCVYLENKLKFSSEMFEDETDRKDILQDYVAGIKLLLDEQKQFFADQFEKNAAKPTPGWHVTINRKKDPDKAVKTMMCLLLCDKTSYGVLD